MISASQAWISSSYQRCIGIVLLRIYSISNQSLVPISLSRVILQLTKHLIVRNTVTFHFSIHLLPTIVSMQVLQPFQHPLYPIRRQCQSFRLGPTLHDLFERLLVRHVLEEQLQKVPIEEANRGRLEVASTSVILGCTVPGKMSAVRPLKRRSLTLND